MPVPLNGAGAVVSLGLRKVEQLDVMDAEREEIVDASETTWNVDCAEEVEEETTFICIS